MKWYYKIKIKDQFEDDTTPELIVKLCTSLSTQLKSIISKIEKLQEEWVYSAYEDLYRIESNFDF